MYGDFVRHIYVCMEGIILFTKLNELGEILGVGSEGFVHKSHRKGIKFQNRSRQQCKLS